MRMRRIVGTPIFLLFALSLFPGCGSHSASHPSASSSQTAPAIDYVQHSTDAIQTLQAWYTPSTGLYQTTGWWNSANAITTLADYSRVTGDKEYRSLFPDVFLAAQHTSSDFLNNFYDDEGW